MNCAAFKAVQAVPALRPVQRLVLYALAPWFSDDRKTAFRSLSDLSTELGMPKGNISRVLADLRERKVIELAAPAIGRRAARYRIPAAAAALEARKVLRGRTLRPEVAASTGSSGRRVVLPERRVVPRTTDLRDLKDLKKENRRCAPAVEPPPDQPPVPVPAPVPMAPDAASAPGPLAGERPAPTPEPAPRPVLVRPTGPTAPAPPPPWKVYAAIAKRALHESLVADRSDDFANVKEHLKRLCAAQQLPYDADIAGRATEAALRDCQVAWAGLRALRVTLARQAPVLRRAAGM